jgi:hypothetical protein
MEKLPTFSSDLVKKLNEMYPLRNPHPSDDLVDIMYRAGQRSVVDSLVSKLRTSEDNILNTDEGDT